MKLYLYAHNDRNLVKVGDKVRAYETKIGTIGTAFGKYSAHLHFSISQGLTIQQLLAYVGGWSVNRVREFYIKPEVDFEKMFDEKMDIGRLGYDWLQSFGNGFHPGVDVNGFGGGNTDLGYEFKSACDGEVIYSQNAGAGWGNVIIIKEEKNMHIVERIIARSKKYLKIDAGKTINAKEDKEIADAIKAVVLGNEELKKSMSVSNNLIYNLEKEIEEKNKKISELEELSSKNLEAVGILTLLKEVLNKILKF